jgi:hypothetical protein
VFTFGGHKGKTKSKNLFNGLIKEFKAVLNKRDELLTEKFPK